MNNIEESFKKRINYFGNIADISKQICKDYGLGEFRSNKIITIGYEDFNYILETENKKYFVKVFAKFRSLKKCQRYIDIIRHAIDAKVSTPKLYKSSHGHLHRILIGRTRLKLCVMEYIEGKSLYETRDKLRKKDILFLAREAAKINLIKLRPKPDYDHWAITHFIREFKIRGKYLSRQDLMLMKPLVEEFQSFSMQHLPHCFVHGDILKTNVIKDRKGRLWIVDFAVSNYYPRIMELAELASNVLFDEKNLMKSKKNLDIAIKEYQKIIKLTVEEQERLTTYIKITHAMHLLWANYKKVYNHNHSAENIYWLEQGRAGLKQMMKG